MVEKQPCAIELEVLERLGGQHHTPSIVFRTPPREVVSDTEEAQDSSSEEAITSFFLPFIPDRDAHTIADVWLMAAHLAEASAFLHSLGYVHRDIKRSNVRFTGTEAVLIDFDCACHWQVGDAPLTDRVGTRGWLAPEVERGKGYGASVDAWGVGLVLLYELLHVCYGWTTRVADDEGASVTILGCYGPQVYSLLSQAGADVAVPPAAKHLVASLLAENPTARPLLADVPRLPCMEPRFWSPGR